MYDPNIEQHIKEQHTFNEDYQHFTLERTDLLSSQERYKHNNI